MPPKGPAETAFARAPVVAGRLVVRVQAEELRPILDRLPCEFLRHHQIAHLVGLEPGLERARRAVLDEIAQLLEEERRPSTAEIVALRERENFLELVENQQRDQSAAGAVAPHIVAVVKELPQRLAGQRRTNVRLLPGLRSSADDRLLDLLRGRRRIRPVVDPHIDRAKPFRPEPRHDARAENGRLPEP